MKRTFFVIALLFSLYACCCMANAKCVNVAVRDNEDVSAWMKFNTKKMNMYVDMLGLTADILSDSDGKPEKDIADANKLIGFLIINNGKDITNGRKLRFESTQLLYAYKKYINADVQMKNCDNARAYFDRIRNLFGKDYLVVDFIGPRLVDPVIDADIYKLEKVITERALLSELDLENVCFSAPEYDIWKQKKADIVFVNMLWGKETSAFGYWEKKPKNGIISAEGLIKAVNDGDGYKFNGGKAFSKDSSMILSAYTAMAIAYDHKPSCKNSRMYLDKIKEFTSHDYQILFPITGEIFDPSEGDVYKEQKKCNLEEIKDSGVPANKCFTKDEYESLFIGK